MAIDLDLKIIRALLEQTVPVLRCHPGLKRPWANDRGTWDSIDDPDRLGGWLQPGDNLAALLGGGKGSPILAVGLDSYKDPAIVDFAQGLGVGIKGANVWAQRTGRIGWTVFYHIPDVALKRDTLQQHSAIDLLTNGYTLIAPSDTSKEPLGGGPYRWLPGHNPLDVPLAELDEPPKGLLAWWLALSAPKLPNPGRNTEAGLSPHWRTGPIPEGQRNETLTKRAGFLHRKIADDEVVRDLLHAANRTHCLPPLPDQEVDTILDSILQREGAGHYRGVQPARFEVGQ
jgi:hypothetical protein